MFLARFTFLLSLLCTSVISAQAVDHDITIQRGNGLANLFNKLNSGQSVTVVWIGGSITQGWGYRDLTMNWFNSRYPGLVREINAGWGGTGSLIGALRYQRDALAHQPDAVFIEFAVNDLPEDPIAFIERNYDGMVQQTWQADQTTDLCFIETMAWYLESPYLAGNLPNTVHAHYNVADHYGIPSVNVGWALYEHVLAGTPWEDLAPDRTHTSAAGAQIYADAFNAYLETERVRNSSAADHILQMQMSDYPVIGSNVYRFYDMNVPAAWTKVANGFGVNGYIETSVLDSTITVPVNGAAAILKVITGPDNGLIKVSLDGGPFYPANVYEFDNYFVWAVPFVKVMLPPGDHTLTVKLEYQGTARLIEIETALTMDPLPPTAPADFDKDGDVDQSDFGLMQACFSGNGNPQNEPTCEPMRLDDDSDVDQNDLLIFDQCKTGAGISADINCGTI